tara:strand:+ start:142 stop:753 length:612 start_codon:yes stop_codon:yes gene_type:complete
MLKYIFLDLGTNIGQGLMEFNKKFNLLNNPEWKIFCFEPNNDIDLESLFPNINNIEYYNKAIWIEDTILEFRKQGSKKNSLIGLGSKIECVKKVYAPSNQIYKIENVEAINFSKFLLNLKDKYPKTSIYVKMDIEGAEFEVIDNLIKTESIKLIKELYCECHGRFNFPLEIQKNEDIKKEIFELENSLKDKVEKYGVKFYFWD